MYSKNPLLVSALKTFNCMVSVYKKDSLEEARHFEKKLYTDLELRGIELRNAREFGHAGRWVRQDPETRSRRLETLRNNGLQTKNFSEKLPDGRSRSSVKAVLSRALSNGQELKKLKNLDKKLLDELLVELQYAQ